MACLPRCCPHSLPAHTAHLRRSPPPRPLPLSPASPSPPSPSLDPALPALDIAGNIWLSHAQLISFKDPSAPHATRVSTPSLPPCLQSLTLPSPFPPSPVAAASTSLATSGCRPLSGSPSSGCLTPPSAPRRCGRVGVAVQPHQYESGSTCTAVRTRQYFHLGCLALKHFKSLSP